MSGGCGKPDAAPPTGPKAAASSEQSLSGPLTIFAAASLAGALTDFKSQLTKTNPQLQITYSFSGSQILVAQIMNGAPADLVATADETSMRDLVGKGLVETPRIFASNKLAIITGKGNPHHIRGLDDLSRRDLRIILADPSVPAGRYARLALAKKGLEVRPDSLELDVKSEVQKVASGEADAAIVYRTDVLAAGSAVTGVAIPDDQNVIVRYHAAVISAGANQQRATNLLSLLLGSPGRKTLKKAGFGNP
ncbi:MAG: molybdate ABC transporter substrate-binding protein [Actinomycetota bacterium]